jgi:hypothetical protein
MAKSASTDTIIGRRLAHIDDHWLAVHNICGFGLCLGVFG